MPRPSKPDEAEAYDEGHRAGRDCVPRDDNPYSPHCEYCSYDEIIEVSWFEGWRDGQAEAEIFG